MKPLGFSIFETLLKPVSDYARKRRIRKFSQLMAPWKNMRILDVGGQPHIWEQVDVHLKITCLNLPGAITPIRSVYHEVQYVEGDGCDMPQFSPGDFDLIYSNSVIEHVGDYKKRLRFANEINRLGCDYWIQTPFKYFPIEAHCGMPFWWIYPQVLREYFLRKWQKTLPAWTDMVRGTDIVSTQEIRSLFPNASITKEWLIFPKSIIAFSNNRPKESRRL